MPSGAVVQRPRGVVTNRISGIRRNAEEPARRSAWTVTDALMLKSQFMMHVMVRSRCLSGSFLMAHQYCSSGGKAASKVG